MKAPWSKDTKKVVAEAREEFQKQPVVIVQQPKRQTTEATDMASVQMKELSRRKAQTDQQDKKVKGITKVELGRIDRIRKWLRDNTTKQTRASEAIEAAKARQEGTEKLDKAEQILVSVQQGAELAHRTPAGLADTVRQVEAEAAVAKQALENGTAEMRRQQEALATALRERDEALQKKGDAETTTAVAIMDTQRVLGQKADLESEINQLNREKVAADKEKADAEAKIPELQQRASNARVATEKAAAELKPVKEARDKALRDATEAAGALKSTEEEVKRIKQELETIILQKDLIKACLEVGKLWPAAKAAEDEYRNARQATWDAGEKVNKATDPAVKTQAEQELTQAKQRQEQAETQYNTAYTPYRQARNHRDELIEKISALATPSPRVKLV